MDVVKAVRRGKFNSGLVKSMHVFRSYRLLACSGCTIRWREHALLSRASRRHSLRLFSGIKGKGHQAACSSTVWQWLFNYQIYQVRGGRSIALGSPT